MCLGLFSADQRLDDRIARVELLDVVTRGYDVAVVRLYDGN